MGKRARAYQPNFQLDLLSAALQAYLDGHCKWESVLTFAQALGYSGAFILLLASRREAIEYVAARVREVEKSSGSDEGSNTTPTPASIPTGANAGENGEQSQ